MRKWPLRSNSELDRGRFAGPRVPMSFYDEWPYTHHHDKSLADGNKLAGAWRLRCCVKIGPIGDQRRAPAHWPMMMAIADAHFGKAGVAASWTRAGYFL